MYITGVKQKYQRKNLKVQEEEYKFPSSFQEARREKQLRENYERQIWSTWAQFTHASEVKLLPKKGNIEAVCEMLY